MGWRGAPARLRRPRRLARVGRVGRVVANCLLLAAVGCTPPQSGAASPPARLYAVSAREKSVVQVDPGSGRVVGTIPLQVKPRQVVPGRWAGGERLLVLGMRSGALTLVERTSGTGQGTWSTRAVVLDAGAFVLHVAGDGGRYAAAAFASTGSGAGPACGVALIDLVRGEVVRSEHVCLVAEESVQTLAVASDAEGPTVYAGIWRRARSAAVVGQGAPAPEPASGRLVVRRMLDETTTRTVALSGVPEQALLAAHPEAARRRLYVVTAVVTQETSLEGTSDASSLAAEASEWRLTGYHAATLDVESEQRLPYRPLWLAAAPDGRRAYAVAGPASLLVRTTLMRVDLAGGGVALLGEMPGWPMGLVVTGDRLYVANPKDNDLWVMSHAGRLVRTIHPGCQPIALAALQALPQ